MNIKFTYTDPLQLSEDLFRNMVKSQKLHNWKVVRVVILWRIKNRLEWL